MDNYSLKPNESVLYKSDIKFTKTANANIELILTNLNLILTTKTKKLFSKEQVNVEVYKIENIKIYNEIPQIKQNGCCVEIYLTNTEKNLFFASKREAHKFVNIAYELLTGKSMSARGADKVKDAVSLVNDTLGIDTVNTVKNVMENGITRSVVGVVSRKVLGKSKSDSTVNGAIDITKNFLEKRTSENTVSQSGTSTIDLIDSQLESIKKMKELLDNGVLTQEEFDAKKKEILGL